MALNTSTDCEIITLDLPPSQVEHDVGIEFRNSSEASRIQQQFGDSRSFNFSPWYGKCDFVWVDACHDYAYVQSDTQQALQLCRPGGWICWHDYRHSAWWSGVTRCVRELSQQYPDIVHLRGTTIATVQKPL